MNYDSYYSVSGFLNDISSDILEAEAWKYEEEWDAFVEEYSGNPDYPDPVEYFKMLYNTAGCESAYTETVNQTYNQSYDDLEYYENDDLPF